MSEFINNKEPFDKLKTGWMSPDGDFYPCEYMEHISAAYEIWDKMYKDLFPDITCLLDQKLIEFGWCEIQVITFMEHGFLFNFARHLTPEQKRVIKPVFEENKHFLIKSTLLDLEEEFE